MYIQKKTERTSPVNDAKKAVTHSGVLNPYSHMVSAQPIMLTCTQHSIKSAFNNNPFI